QAADVAPVGCLDLPGGSHAVGRAETRREVVEVEAELRQRAAALVLLVAQAGVEPRAAERGAVLEKGGGVVELLAAAERQGHPAKSVELQQVEPVIAVDL